MSMDKYINKKLVERFKQLINKERFQNPPIEQKKYGSFDFDIKDNSVSFYNVNRIDEIKKNTLNYEILKKIGKYEKEKSKNKKPNTLSFGEKYSAKKVFKKNNKINKNTSRSTYLFEHNKKDVLKNKYKEYKKINNSSNITFLDTINFWIVILFSLIPIFFIGYHLVYRCIILNILRSIGLANNNYFDLFYFINVKKNNFKYIIFFVIFFLFTFIIYGIKTNNLTESKEKFIEKYLINLHDLSENGDIYTRMSENHIDYNEINNYMNYKRSAPIKINLFKDEDIKIEKTEENKKSSNIGINIFHLIINIGFLISAIIYMVNERNKPATTQTQAQAQAQAQQAAPAQQAQAAPAPSTQATQAAPAQQAPAQQAPAQQAPAPSTQATQAQAPAPAPSTQVTQAQAQAPAKTTGGMIKGGSITKKNKNNKKNKNKKNNKK